MSLAAFFFSTMPKAPPPPVIWYPTSTVSYTASRWGTSGANTPASMHTFIDEVTADDADYAFSAVTGTQTAELVLGGGAVVSIDYAVLKIRLKWPYVCLLYTSRCV